MKINFLKGIMSKMRKTKKTDQQLVEPEVTPAEKKKLADVSPDDVAELRKTRKVLEDQIQSIESTLEKTKNDLDETNKELADGRAQLALLVKERDAAKKAVDQLRDSANAFHEETLKDATEKAAKMESDALERIQKEDALVQSQRKALSDSQNLALKKREDAVAEKEIEINKKEQEIIAQLSQGYLAEKKRLETEKQRKEDEIEQLSKDEEAKKKSIDAEVASYHTSELAKANKAFDLEQASLEKELAALKTEIAGMESEKEQIEKDKEANGLRDQQLTAAEKAMEARRDAFDAVVDEAVNKRYPEIVAENQSVKDKNSEILADYRQAIKENKDLKEAKYLQNVMDAKALGQRVTELEADNKRLKSENIDLSKKVLSTSEAEAAKQKATEFDKLLSEKIELTKRNDELMQQVRSGESYQTQIDTQSADNTYLKKEVTRLTTELQKHQSPDRDERIKPITTEVDSFKEFLQLQKYDGQDEAAWLDRIEAKTRESGIIFSKRLLYAYHTSVKVEEWSPLVVLAGVSGTGKSELPRQYAIHGGMAFLPIAVKPDWDSPQSLFGFYNSIENKFEPTELLRALYAFQDRQNSDYDGRMLMVLLDEMNLAHVELYFADLLSKFETSRGTSSRATIDLDLGAGEDPLSIQIRHNVLWTGTMNEDETTKALSDKVLDRSTLITFPRPKKFYSRNAKIQNAAPEFYLPQDTWRLWQDSSFDPKDADQKLLASFQETVESINAEMASMGRNLGHRVWQGMENYIFNHPTITCGQKKGAELSEALKNAFAEALVFKVMPKLRGLETQGDYEPIFKRIAGIIHDKVPTVEVDFTRAISLPSGIFQWVSADFLEDK
jgi:hypothetical protein